MELDLKGIEKQLGDLMGTLTKDLSTDYKKVQDNLQAMIKPIEEKIVNINGTNCVIQLFKDGVKILHPDAKTHFESLGKEKKVCWYKQLIKRK